MEKLCRTCHALKPLEEYHKHKTSKDGRESQCKTCRNKQIMKTRKLRYSKSASFRESKRNETLRKLYGITVDDYEEMFKRQGGVCAICHQPETGNIRMAVDHCHASGKVRGLLCKNCNTALGNLKDSIEILTNAITYLQENN
uniref:Endonuclease VII n=1 Tax=Escherichia phage Baskent_phicoli_1 TaxID=3145031 RepID=A0AAU8BB03_9CAUD